MYWVNLNIKKAPRIKFININMFSVSTGPIKFIWEIKPPKISCKGDTIWTPFPDSSTKGLVKDDTELNMAPPISLILYIYPILSSKLKVLLLRLKTISGNKTTARDKKNKKALVFSFFKKLTMYNSISLILFLYIIL